MKSLVLPVTLLIGWAVASLSSILAADEPAAVSLRLRNGYYVPGSWLSIESPKKDGAATTANQLGTIQWQASGLVQPLNVYWEQVAGIYLPIANAASTKPTGTHGFELATGDVVYGNLKSLSRESVEIESTRFGVLRMPTNSVRQMFTNQNAEVIVIGPQGTKGWYSAQPKNSQQGIDPLANNPQQVVEWVRSPEKLKQWSDQGPPSTNVVGAQLRSEFELPAKSRIELELSWQKHGEFAIFVGGGLKERRDRTAFRLEVWEKELVLIREDDDVADVRTLMPINPGAGSVRLQLFHDRAAERLIVFSGSGAALADLQFKLHARAPGGKARVANNQANVVVQARNANNAGPNAQLPPAPNRTEASELVITNYQGDLRLDSIRVSAWSGVVPQLVDSTKPRLQRNNGQLEVGELISFDAAQKSITFKTEKGDRTESLDQFSQIVLSEKRAAASGSELQLFLHDGTRLIGRPANSTAGRLRLRHASIEQEIEVPLADLQTVSVAVADKASAKPAETIPASTSVLSWDQGVLHGRLVDGQESAAASCLVWQADAAQSPTALARDFNGRIVYGGKALAANPGTPQAATPNAGAGNAAVPMAMVRIAQRVVANAIPLNPNVPAPKEPTPGPPAAANQANASPAAYRIHLRSGEIIPCNQLTIDDEGLKIQSSVSTANRLPNELIKAVEMTATAKPPKLTNVKRQRLLMLPRVSRDNPPTHVVRSVDGDYLRGRLIQLTDQQLTVEVRVETKQIPRALVSHIIWVHADELDQPPGSVAPGAKPGEAKPSDGKPSDAKPAEKPAEKPAPQPTDKPGQNPTGLLVQALRADGVRVGFEPRETKAGVIAGVNRYLGEVRVDVREVEELLIGKAIGQAVAQMPYSQWRWTAATLPKIVLSEQNSGDGSRKPGSDSPLVGKAAPDFKLPMLAGKEEFVLSQQKGRIVVLDFWATWCGPCLKTMPLLEKVVSELPKDAKVDLIAVNLEEQPRQITSMLERHKLKVNVALDQDGAVAAKYSATAIPQTVIIDREGKVVRLFVGGGPQFEKELRDALTEILGPPPSNGGAVPAPKPVQAD
ncbi:MAG: TlpA family protein disulfide reductase [Planctomycetota bacterium]